ncbi:hypothetical protein PUN28_000758 [Cardiocondyla obscurior]|uniref:Uncharacterized protein n=1 Tax=Cardiocondyla obscurior TaxID=286306 RepID=A0AAW2H0X2_9HYME
MIFRSLEAQLPHRVNCQANRAHLLLMCTYALNLRQFCTSRWSRASCDEDTTSVGKHVVKRMKMDRNIARGREMSSSSRDDATMLTNKFPKVRSAGHLFRSVKAINPSTKEKTTKNTDYHEREKATSGGDKEPAERMEELPGERARPEGRKRGGS